MIRWFIGKLPLNGEPAPDAINQPLVRLTTETARQRWLILSCVWAFIAWLAVLDSRAISDYVALLDDSAVLPADSLPLRRSAPSDYADAQTWVRFALALDSSGAWRLRHTDIDNAPAGRAVHWNSAFAHLVANAGKLRQSATGKPIAIATEQSLAWINLPLLLSVIVFFSALVAQRLGAAAGTLIALGMLGHPQFYAGFAPNNVDHHGLLSAASIGIVLGLLLMGVGWWRPRGEEFSLLPDSPRAARAGALVSAVSGAIGMWISAASVIPTIAFAGVAGLLATWWLGVRADEGEHFDGNLWRLWGRVGASVSLLFYLAEYAPHDVALRLEVNHPLYALAWLGGGELIAMLAEWRIARVRPAIWKIIVAVLALSAAPTLIAFGGARVFVPLDAGIARLHESISEFRSMLSLARAGGLSHYALALLLVLPVGAVAIRRAKDRVLIVFSATCVVASVALAFWQIRWWLPASGVELCLLLVVVSSLVATRRQRTRWMVVAVVCAMFVEQAVARIRLTRSNVESSAVTIADAAQPLYRDVASAIRVAQPHGDVVLLASPNASAGVSYFGGFKSLGTLYWENAEGLRAAAAIFSARTDDEARALMHARGVTHIAMIGQTGFLEQYLELARPGASPDEMKQTFGYRLLQDESVPRWLRAVPVAARGGATPAELQVRVMQVVPEQSEPEALWNIAIARLAAADTAGAEQNFRSAIALFPTSKRASMYDAAARLAYKSSAHRLALRLFAEAIAITPTTATKVGMAWILATSTDDGARDGSTAIAMIQPLVQQSPDDPALLDVFAAALAETRRFADAVTVAERVVAIHQRAADSSATAHARERLDAYRAARPWRTR